MNFKRGLIAGLIGTVAGALIPALWIGGYTLLYWFWHDSPAMDRGADLAYWQDYGAGPVIGLAIYFGLSAWATYTPPGKHRFVSTLGIMFVISIPLSLLLSSLQLTPQGKRAPEDPTLFFSEFLIIVLPPLAVAGLIVLFRWSRWPDMEDAPQPPSPHT
jgi:hypothetical protein